jgi:hypothetical protein
VALANDLSKNSGTEWYQCTKATTRVTASLHWYRMVPVYQSTKKVKIFWYRSGTVTQNHTSNRKEKKGLLVVRPFFAPLTALKKELDDELRKKDTEIPLSVHWGIFI